MASNSTFAVERTRVINASRSSVYAAINDFHEWVHWSPWEGMDPNLQRTYTGPSSGPGASYAWQGSRKVGAGSMTITEVNENERVVIDLAFLKPFKAQNVATFALTGEGDTTSVTWTMTGTKNLFSKIMGLFMNMDKMIGRDFEKGLAQLETYLKTRA